MARNVYEARKKLWSVCQLKADVSAAYNAMACWIHPSQTPREWLSHILMTQNQHISKYISGKPENDICLFLSVTVPWMAISMQLHVTAAKFFFMKSHHQTLYISLAFLCFCFLFLTEEVWENLYRNTWSLQDYKVPHQRAKMLRTSQKSPNKTRRFVSCTVCPEAISGKEARSALCPLLISFSCVRTSHPMSV